MKRRITAAVSMFLLFSCLSLILGYNAHQFFSHQYFFSWSMRVCIRGLAIPAVRSWLALLEGCSLLATVWMCFGREYIKYKSKMIHVCLDIYTPMAEGQGQYGTARWLEEKDKARVFTMVHVDLGTPLLRELIAYGREDLEGQL